MSRRGNDWQNPSNPNMAPLPPRRAGIGAAGGVPGAMSPPNGGGGGGSTPGAPSTMYAGPPPPLGTAAPAFIPAGGAGVPGAPGRPPGPPPSLAPGAWMNGPPPGPAPVMPGGPSMYGGGGGGGVEVATTLFVGSISVGCTDEWLGQLLSACGHLRNLKRVSNAFGFAEYADPDAVLRAIALLNGITVPAWDPKNPDAPSKKLTVKADEKTKKFLEQYQENLIKTDEEEQRLAGARRSVEAILARMADPSQRQGEGKSTYETPAHLKDLSSEELPEEHRGSVLSEIEMFRQSASARKEDQRRRDAELERLRIEEQRRNAQMQQQQQQQHRQQTSTVPLGDRMNGMDPQSYRNAPAFVPSADRRDEVNMEPEERDAMEEKRRVERKKHDSAMRAKEAQERYEPKERARLAHFERVQETLRKEAAKAQALADKFVQQSRELDQKLAREDQLFYKDRARWRAFRTPTRQREEEADREDEVAEAEEIERAKEESERFLANQAKEMEALAEAQRKAGILLPGSGVEKLKLKVAAGDGAHDAGQSSAGGVGGAAAHSAAPQPKVLGDDEEDDDKAKGRRKLRTLELGDGKSNEEREKERMDKVRIVQEGLPQERAKLMAMQPRWDYVDQYKYRPIVDDAILESIGERVPELVDAVAEKLSERAKATDLVEVLEPVLADESPAFVERLWRTLVTDSLVAAAGLAF